MKFIDEKLGGTTPLEIIVKFPEIKKILLVNMMMILMTGKMKMKKYEKYWFTKDKVK